MGRGEGEECGAQNKHAKKNKQKREKRKRKEKQKKNNTEKTDVVREKRKTRG